MDAHMHGHFMFAKCKKATKGENVIFSTKWFLKMFRHPYKKTTFYFTVGKVSEIQNQKTMMDENKNVGQSNYRPGEM